MNRRSQQPSENKRWNRSHSNSQQSKRRKSYQKDTAASRSRSRSNNKVKRQSSYQVEARRERSGTGTFGVTHASNNSNNFDISKMLSQKASRRSKSPATNHKQVDSSLNLDSA